MVVLHFPQTQLVGPIFLVNEPNLIKEFFLVGAVATLDEAITAGKAFRNQGMDAPAGIDHFGEMGLALGVSGVLHCKVYRVVSESDEKGGSRSSERSKTLAIVAISELS